MLSKEDLLVMSYNRSKAGGGERGHAGRGDLGQKGDCYKWAGGAVNCPYPGRLGSKRG